MNPVSDATSAIKSVFTVRNFFYFLAGMILINLVVSALVNAFPDNKIVTGFYRLFTNPYSFFQKGTGVIIAFGALAAFAALALAA